MARIFEKLLYVPARVRHKITGGILDMLHIPEFIDCPIDGPLSEALVKAILNLVDMAKINSSEAKKIFEKIEEAKAQCRK